MRALILLLAACSHAAPMPAGPGLVQITNWPDRPETNCYFDEVASVPEPMIQTEAIGFDRIVVHMRDYQALLSWMADFRMHVSQLRDCLREMGVRVTVW